MEKEPSTPIEKDIDKIDPDQPWDHLIEGMAKGVKALEEAEEKNDGTVENSEVKNS